MSSEITHLDAKKRRDRDQSFLAFIKSHAIVVILTKKSPVK